MYKRSDLNSDVQKHYPELYDYIFRVSKSDDPNKLIKAEFMEEVSDSLPVNEYMSHKQIWKYIKDNENLHWFWLL